MGKSSKARGKGILIILLILIVIAAGFFLVKAKNAADSDKLFAMSGNAERVEFLNRQGYIVKPDPVRREDVVVPSEFNDTYKSYVDMQTAQGLDLAEHKGDKATLFSYAVLNYPEYSENVFADLLVADDKLIACQLKYEDEENGFIKPLIVKGVEPVESETGPAEKKADALTETSVETTAETAVTENDDASEAVFVPEDETNFE
ncbi:MAG: DUF4830 domain-containing protein [Oscillospiraceae bacterium]